MVKIPWPRTSSILNVVLNLVPSLEVVIRDVLAIPGCPRYRESRDVLAIQQPTLVANVGPWCNIAHRRARWFLWRSHLPTRTCFTHDETAPQPLLNLAKFTLRLRFGGHAARLHSEGYGIQERD